MDLRITGVYIISLLILLAIFVPAGYSEKIGGINIVAYATKGAYLSNEEVQIKYFIYFDNGRPAYGGRGFWELRYFYNNTPIKRGNFTLPSGVIGILPQVYGLDTNRYSLTITYTVENLTLSKKVNFFIVNYSHFHYALYLNPMPGNYIQVIINDDVEYLVSGIYLNIPLPELPVEFISLYSDGREIGNISQPFQLDEYGKGFYYLRLPENITKVTIFASVARKVMSISYTPKPSTNFYFSEVEEPLLSGGFLNLSVRSVKEFNEELYYHFEIRDAQNNLLYYTWGNSSGINYRISPNYNGILKIHCDIYNSTTKVYSLESFYSVRYANLNIYFDRENYVPNSTFQVFVDFKSYVIRNATFIYNVMANFGSGYVTLFTRVSQERELKVKVPEDAPSSYRVEVYAVSSDFSYFSSEEIDIVREVSLQLELLTKSSYVTNVYAPGQVIEIRYSLSKSVDEGRLLYGIDEYFYKEPQVTLLSKEKEGVVSIKIPENAATGIHEIHFLLKYKDGEVERTILINVDAEPPWTFYDIIGMPLGYFILILIFLVIVILLISLRISEKRLKKMKNAARVLQKKNKKESKEKGEKSSSRGEELS